MGEPLPFISEPLGRDYEKWVAGVKFILLVDRRSVWRQYR